jgi:hypothetical protein
MMARGETLRPAHPCGTLPIVETNVTVLTRGAGLAVEAEREDAFERQAQEVANLLGTDQMSAKDAALFCRRVAVLLEERVMRKPHPGPPRTVRLRVPCRLHPLERELP